MISYLRFEERQMISMIKAVKYIIKEELLFFLIAILTLIGSFFITPKINSIDWKVIACLFDLMLISKALENQKILDKIALLILKRFNTTKKMTTAIILITALLAMFMTNDVALLTMVPLTIIISKKIGTNKNAFFNPAYIIILETVAANIGSSLTPFGNPQNLFLYSYYSIPTLKFLKMTISFTIIGIASLLFINYFIKSNDIQYEIETVPIKNPKKVLIYLLLFILVLLSVLRIINYLLITSIVTAVFLFWDINIIKKIDYFLIGTFIMFFLLIDIISNMNLIQIYASSLLNTPLLIFISSALSSQIISNVPSGILFSTFTKQYEPLLLGVSVGGLGTLIASLANLISYKLYKREYRNGKYALFFYSLNFGMLVVYLCIYSFIFIKYS